MSIAANTLTQDDMVIPRSPRELCGWVASKASELAQTKEGKAYVRSGALLPKKLMEEIRPLGLFAFHRFGPDEVTCIPNLGNENFDGRIQFSDPSHASLYVEITYAKDGYDERLRLGVLSNKRSVNALGRIRVKGTKAAGGQRVDVEDEAVDHESIRNAAMSLVKERLTGKSGKKYGPQHILVVVVDDYIAFRTEEDKIALRECAEEVTASLAMDFGAIYLLGSSGNYLERIRGQI